MCHYAGMVPAATVASDETCSGRSSSHRRAWYLGVGLGLAALAAAGIAAHGHSRGSGEWVQLRSGSYHGVSWRLDAREQHGHLCLSVDSPKGPSDTQHGFAGACVFEYAPTKASDFWAGGLGPDRSYVNFGPVPSNAVAIRIATNQLVPTYPLPAGHGLPHARFWIDFEPGGRPSPTQGTTARPQPLDSKGRSVAFQPY